MCCETIEMIAALQAEGRLQLGAERDQVAGAAEPRRKGQAQRREAAAEADRGDRPAVPAQDAVVDPHGNAPVVAQDHIRDLGENRARRAVVDDLRQVRQVAAGHDQDLVAAREQQMMQR